MGMGGRDNACHTPHTNPTRRLGDEGVSVRPSRHPFTGRPLLPRSWEWRTGLWPVMPGPYPSSSTKLVQDTKWTQSNASLLSLPPSALCWSWEKAGRRAQGIPSHQGPLKQDKHPNLGPFPNLPGPLRPTPLMDFRRVLAWGQYSCSRPLGQDKIV